MNGVKTCGINRKEALTVDWEELNKKTCMLYMFTKQRKGLLLHANIN